MTRIRLVTIAAMTLLVHLAGPADADQPSSTSAAKPATAQEEIIIRYVRLKRLMQYAKVCNLDTTKKEDALDRWLAAHVNRQDPAITGFQRLQLFAQATKKVHATTRRYDSCKAVRKAIETESWPGDAN